MLSSDIFQELIDRKHPIAITTEILFKAWYKCRHKAITNMNLTIQRSIGIHGSPSNLGINKFITPSISPTIKQQIMTRLLELEYKHSSADIQEDIELIQSQQCLPKPQNTIVNIYGVYLLCYFDMLQTMMCLHYKLRL